MRDRRRAVRAHLFFKISHYATYWTPHDVGRISAVSPTRHSPFGRRVDQVRLLPKAEYHLNPGGCLYRRSRDDLRLVCVVAAAWAARERAAIFGDFQSVPDRLLRDFRAVFPHPAAGAVGARADRGSHEA